MTFQAGQKKWNGGNSFIGLVWLFLQCVGVTCWPTSLSIDIWGCSMDMAGSKKILFCVFQKQEPTRKDCNQLQECISLFFFFFDSISFLFRERKNASTILEKGKTNFKHAFSTLSKNTPSLFDWGLGTSKQSEWNN